MTQEQAGAGAPAAGAAAQGKDEPAGGAADSPVAADDGAAAPDPVAAMRQVDAAAADRLVREWGADFDARLARARSAAEAVADPELVAVLEETGLGNDPRILRAAARIGELIEARAALGAAADGAARRALEDELDKLVSDPDYWSDRVQRRVRRIFLDLHGGAALPVHRMARDAGGVR